MKNINDYKGTKTAIHCKTQDEWDKINELIGEHLNMPKDFGVYGSESCLYMDGSRSDCQFASEDGYTIIPASEFMPIPRTIEQIETELEVLRNELELLKAQTPKKKPIEFVKYLNSNMVAESNPSSPQSWINIKVLCRYNVYDIMKAWDDNENNCAIFIGHFNDGVK